MAELKGLKVIRCDSPGCGYTETFYPKIEEWGRYSGTVLDGSCGENAKWHACSIGHISDAVSSSLDDKYRNEP